MVLMQRSDAILMFWEKTQSSRWWQTCKYMKVETCHGAAWLQIDTGISGKRCRERQYRKEMRRMETQVNCATNGWYMHTSKEARRCCCSLVVIRSTIDLDLTEIIAFLSAYTKVPSLNQLLNMFMDYIRCDAHHGRAGGECQQPGEQSLQLLDDSWWRLHKHRLQAGQCGQLDALIRTQQRLQQQRQKLEGCKKKRE